MEALLSASPFLSLSLSLLLPCSVSKLSQPCTDYGSGTPLPDSLDYL